MTSEEFFMAQKMIYIAFAKSRFTVFDNIIFDSG